MPPRPVLAALLVLATAPPFIAQAAGTLVGSFAMFAQVERYRIEAEARSPAGLRKVTMHELFPHLSRDATMVLGPADGYAPSAGQADVVDAGLPELAQLICRVHGEAIEVAVRLYRGRFGHSAEVRREVTVPCEASRASTR